MCHSLVRACREPRQTMHCAKPTRPRVRYPPRQPLAPRQLRGPAAASSPEEVRYAPFVRNPSGLHPASIQGTTTRACGYGDCYAVSQPRPVGRKGVGRGLGSWLTYGGSVEAETAVACIERAYDKGVTFFDTANAYGRGRAEEVVGGALRAYARDSYVLATKVLFFPMGRGRTIMVSRCKHVFGTMRTFATTSWCRLHRSLSMPPLRHPYAARGDVPGDG